MNFWRITSRNTKSISSTCWGKFHWIGWTSFNTTTSSIVSIIGRWASGRARLIWWIFKHANSTTSLARVICLVNVKTITTCCFTGMGKGISICISITNINTSFYVSFGKCSHTLTYTRTCLIVSILICRTVHRLNTFLCWIIHKPIIRTVINTKIWIIVCSIWTGCNTSVWIIIGIGIRRTRTCHNTNVCV